VTEPSDGYIKYQAEWVREPCEVPGPLLAELERWRGRMRQLELVGVLPDGIGYGNLSARVSASGPFWITGSATGGLESLSHEHYARVDAVEIARNWLHATGLTEASSESLTHAALYGAVPECRAVIHVHCTALWRSLLDQGVDSGWVPNTSGPLRHGSADARGMFPGTDPAAAYGTPAMAFELARLAPLVWESAQVEERRRNVGMVAMTGHPDGVIAFGVDLASVGEYLQKQFAGLASSG